MAVGKKVVEILACMASAPFTKLAVNFCTGPTKLHWARC